MFLKNLEINNFRSFDSQSIIFPEINKPICIIWGNNVGKTNIIQSILMLLWCKYMWEESLSENDYHKHNTDERIVIKGVLKHNLEWNEEESGLEFITKDNICESPSICKDWTYIKYDIKKEITKRVFYFDFQEITKALKVKSDWSYTVLWKKIKEFREEFKKDTTKINHRWIEYTRAELTEKWIKSIVDKYIKSEDFSNFVNEVKEKLEEQLNIETENVEVDYGIIEVDKIINNFTFYLKNSPDWPLLPIDNMGF